eukprot:TRINITY_DN743_c0_g1_i16.p1 TRINITY_DN743_c0_g1~~TRINITY_DN743_c0_g1_i16.p1  ORF type:complete len:415 (-),score=1.96 TRINITY_DN743_c0_g1_i16:232-1476(-)
MRILQSIQDCPSTDHVECQMQLIRAWIQIGYVIIIGLLLIPFGYQIYTKYSDTRRLWSRRNLILILIICEIVDILTQFFTKWFGCYPMQAFFRNMAYIFTLFYFVRKACKISKRDSWVKIFRYCSIGLALVFFGLTVNGLAQNERFRCTNRQWLALRTLGLALTIAFILVGAIFSRLTSEEQLERVTPLIFESNDKEVVLKKLRKGRSLLWKVISVNALACSVNLGVDLYFLFFAIPDTESPQKDCQLRFPIIKDDTIRIIVEASVYGLGKIITSIVPIVVTLYVFWRQPAPQRRFEEDDNNEGGGHYFGSLVVKNQRRVQRSRAGRSYLTGRLAGKESQLSEDEFAQDSESLDTSNNISSGIRRNLQFSESDLSPTSEYGNGGRSISPYLPKESNSTVYSQGFVNHSNSEGLP